MPTNRLVPPKVTTRDLAQNARYRISGVVRGNSANASDVTDAQVLAGLTDAGFTQPFYWPAGMALPPDWPDESTLPALSNDERPFRFEGTYTSPAPLPNALSVVKNGYGSAILWLLWEYVQDNKSTSDVDILPVTYTTEDEIQPQAKSNSKLFAITTVIGVVVGAIGFAVYLNREGIYKGIPITFTRDTIAYPPYPWHAKFFLPQLGRIQVAHGYSRAEARALAQARIDSVMRKRA